jgi:putative transcriptional regulator
MIEDRHKIGKKIKEFRKRAGLSQLELEHKVGLASGTISRIENNGVNPTKETILKIIEVLNLRTYEAASLFNLEVQDFPRIVTIARKLSTSLNIDKVLQSAVNDITYELNLLSAVIFLIKENKVYSVALNQSPLASLFLKYIPMKFTTLSVSLETDKDNYIVKTILNRKNYYSQFVSDFAMPALSKRLSDGAQKLTGTKSGISLPVMYEDNCIGAVVFFKSYIDDFSNELKILEAFTGNIGVAVVNAQEYGKLLEEIKLLRSKN